MHLTNEEMDKRCVMIKNQQYCRNVSKKAWQERYLSYNPTVSEHGGADEHAHLRDVL